MNPLANRRSERGAMLVQVGLSILALTAVTAYVVDYGVLWVAKNQAQNSADAGALAGAIARAYDEVTDPPATGGMAEQSARRAALCASGSPSCPGTPLSANPVWRTQAAASSTVNVSWGCPPGFTGRCAQVDVYRNGQFASTPLPTFFGLLIGRTSQGVRATATARAATANSTDCLRPWAVADKWIENATTPGIFERWTKVGTTLTELNPHDIYRLPWDTTVAGPTGYKYPADVGTQVTLIHAQSTDTAIPTGWSLSIQLPDGAGGYSGGSAAYGNAIANCVGQPVKIGDYLPTENMGAGQTKIGFDALKAKDPGATWNTTLKDVQGSCAPGCAPFSPRIVPIAIFDMDDYQKRKSTSPENTSVCPVPGGQCVHIVNIIGFFAASRPTTGPNQDNVTGYLMSMPGDLAAGGVDLGPAGFLKIIQLVR
jgi:hypothetical protein